MNHGQKTPISLQQVWTCLLCLTAFLAQHYSIASISSHTSLLQLVQDYNRSWRGYWHRRHILRFGDRSHWLPFALGSSSFWWSIILMFFSAFSMFLNSVSSLRLIFFWSSRAQLMTITWNFWLMGTGGASVTQAACRAISWFREPSISSSNFFTISSIMDVALRRASSCWEFLIVPTEISTDSVRPIRRFAVKFNSSLSPRRCKARKSVPSLKKHGTGVKRITETPMQTALRNKSKPV